MDQAPRAPAEDLRSALSAMLRDPIRTIIPPWSWKAATCSAVVRALFFATNLQSGRTAATKAMLIEAAYAVFAGGLIGAVSQQLRCARPLWATGLLICLGLPTLMTLAQLAVHHFAKTPHQSGGVIVSLCFAALAAAYSWYAMRRGRCSEALTPQRSGTIYSHCREFRSTSSCLLHVR